MEKKKLGLVPKLIIAIILGILFGQFLPEAFCRVVVTASGLFSTFLKFIIPLMIVAYVTMGIADLSQGAGKLLIITVCLAYGSTLIAGSCSYLVASNLFPSFMSPEAMEQMAKIVMDFKKNIPTIEKYNLKIAIENHCDLFADEVIWMVEQLNHPLIGACCDTINSLMMAEGIKDCVDKMAPYCYCVHFCDNRVFADPDGTHSLGCAIGDGDVDVVQVMKILREKAPEELDTIDLEIELPLSGYSLEEGRKLEIEAMRKSIKYMHEVLDIGIKGR